MTPVTFRVERPVRQARIHVLIRALLLFTVGSLGCSSLYWLLYLALPAMIALLLAQEGADRYLVGDAPRVTRVLRVIAAAYAYLWLLTDEFPTTSTPASVQLELTPGGTPTPGSALTRLLTSLPALILLVLLSCASGIVWLVGAVFLLVRERLPAGMADFLELTLRYQLRLVAYHLSLVDAYPSLSEAPVTTVSHPAA